MASCQTVTSRHWLVSLTAGYKCIWCDTLALTPVQLSGILKSTVSELCCRVGVCLGTSSWWSVEELQLNWTDHRVELKPTQNSRYYPSFTHTIPFVASSSSSFFLFFLFFLLQTGNNLEQCCSHLEQERYWSFHCSFICSCCQWLKSKVNLFIHYVLQAKTLCSTY